MPYLVRCNGCNASVILDGEQMADPDSYLNCDPSGSCCLQDHHHAQMANETGVPCRPLTIIPLQGSAQVVM
jgi:phage terminase large subunit GpA-like protein